MKELRNSTGRISRGALAAAALAVAVLAVGPGTASADPDPGKLKKQAERKTKKKVKKDLPHPPGRGLAKSQDPVKVKVSSCKQRTKGGDLVKFKCKWSAHGELRGRVLLRCNGKATYKVKSEKVAKGADCVNITELQAPLLADPHPILFGYFEDFGTLPGLWDEAEAGGSDVIREGIQWKVLQPEENTEPNEWRWRIFDEVHDEATERGLVPVFTLRNAPCWAAPSPCSEGGPNPVAPEHVDEFAEVAAEIAKRYGDNLLAVEIWFEPNGVPFWGARPDPAAFANLVKAASDAIHATDTGVQAWTGGLAPGAASPDKIPYPEFLDQALAAGGIQSADAVAFHAVTDVPFKPGDDPTQGYLGRLRIQIQSLQSALTEHDVALPIVLTQLSYSTGPGEYTEAEQAEALVTSYELVRRLRNVPTAIVSRLYDNGDGDKVAGFGVLNPDGSPKPAYCQLAAAHGAATPPIC